MTQEEVEHAVGWFQNAMGMSNWAFELSVQDDPPNWVGKVSPSEVATSVSSLRFKTGMVWISPARCKANEEETDELSTLFHELMHSLAKEAGVLDDGNDRKEFFWDKLAEALRMLYLRIEEDGPGTGYSEEDWKTLTDDPSDADNTEATS
ncbi:hypothetical protein LCGC14_0236350 [marine sediment metagenome]|uniref:Uncharacterized protein n=1 Tax=marine sediment metagenome TaxID=412755 RepID=A0A0F9UQN1_9ZZZZ